jgi:hypothetical protein
VSNSHSSGAMWTAVVVCLIYLGIWLFCKMTGQKAEMPS